MVYHDLRWLNRTCTVVMTPNYHRISDKMIRGKVSFYYALKELFPVPSKLRHLAHLVYIQREKNARESS